MVGDARRMDELADDSVALVVTSPPYFSGKEYERALGEGHVPGSYFEYLQMLEDVFAECVRKLEPGRPNRGERCKPRSKALPESVC